MRTDITVVLDRSGSMEPLADDVIGGLNAFVTAQQQVDGEAWLTLVQFDDEYEVVHFRAPIAEVPPMSRDAYQPRGTTALLDAVGRTILDVSARLGGMPAEDRPDQVLFVVQTDGQENASREFTREQIFRLIDERQRQATAGTTPWEFVFLAANQDAITEGGRMGFTADRAMDFDATKGGVVAMYDLMSEKVATKRRQADVPMSFTASDRARTRGRRS